VKCPKCESKDVSKTVFNDYGNNAVFCCNNCKILFVDWQQSIIDQQKQIIADNNLAFSNANEIIGKQERTIDQQKAEIERLNNALSLHEEKDRIANQNIVAVEHEISRLRSILRGIAEHEHCSIDCMWHWPEDSHQKQGHAEGHRCCAEIARKGLDPVEGVR